MKKMDLKERIDIELKITRPFGTLHDLAYFLVDLNSSMGVLERLSEGRKFAEKNNIYSSRRAIERYKEYA